MNVRSLFRSFRLVIPAVVGLLVASCGWGRMATGVVVWAPDNGAVHNGEIVWIWEQSHIRNTYTIERPKGGGRFEVDQWRVERFSGDKDAEDFLKTFGPVAETWAVSGKMGLPVRERADSASDRVYRLGEGEVVKVLAAGGPSAKEGNLDGRWVEVITNGGYRGWVFDYYLTLYSVQDGKKVFLKSSGGGDDLIQSVLAKSWYPDAMRQMLDEHRVNLALFRPDAGLRTSQTPPTFELTLPRPGADDEHFALPVETARKLGSSLYSFGGPNQVKVQFTNADGSRMDLSFQWQGQTRTVPLALLDENVSTVISDELASRQQRLQEILGRGSTLVSPTYGTIKIQPDGSFQWLNFATAVPQAAVGSGQIVFDWFNKKMFNDYRAIRFQFGTDGTAFSQVFLYRFLKDGLLLLPAADTDLDPATNLVLHVPTAGLTYYFTFGS